MLAAKADSLEDIRYPCIVTPKLDGVRCLVVQGEARSRAFKPIPNRHVSRKIAGMPEGLDGELMTMGDFNDAQSAFMSEAGEPNFTYCLFDWYRPNMDYWDRLAELDALAPSLPSFCMVLQRQLVNNITELSELEGKYVKAGYEGIVARCPRSPYKFGRSTLKQHWMVKYKRKDNEEAVIVGFEEQYQNLNPQVPNNFGRMKRPGGAGGLGGYAPKGTLGAFIVRDLKTNVQFRIGTGEGLTETLRQKIWNERDSYLGLIISYTCQGSKEKPRFPIFRGFRHEDDL